MKSWCTLTLATLAGYALGALVLQAVHAQTRPLIYYVVEVETTDADAYAKEFAPKAQAIIKAAGGRFVAIGGSGATGAKTLMPIEGDPPKRAIIMVWDDMEQVRSWWRNPDYIALRKIVDKYATFCSFSVEAQ
jgi:uncharacterized protein (DUF1330 family)